jgi:hypothetical protein
MRRVVVLLSLSLLACGKGAPALDDEPRAATVVQAGAVIKAGSIGTAGGAEASYALVDVQNTSTQDRLITLEGQLADEDGRPVAALGPDELRVPAGDRRTFALVADRTAPPGARARFTVTHAVALDYLPQIELTERRERSGELFVATARARNVVERPANAVLACTFYGDGGKILARPFTLLELAPGEEKALRFEGPRDATRAKIFVGQVAFKP